MADDVDKKNAKSAASRIPADKINLKVILVSGNTEEFLFTPADNVSVVTQYIFDNWPDGWSEEEQQDTNILRLIYQGRFLHGNVSLGALQLPTGRTTVMHLVPRENLPEPNSQGNTKRDKGVRTSATQRRAQSSGCCGSCLIS